MSFDAASAVLEHACASGRIPGGVLGQIKFDGRKMVRATGFAQITPEKREMTPDTWFDLASLTKVIFTTERILALANQGQIDLDKPLTSVLPDLRQYDHSAWERQVTFRQCLGHQTSFPAVVPLYTYGDDPERLRAFVLQREWPKGPAVYSDINFILLGIVIERLMGCRLRHLDPGFGFSFQPPANQTAATENCTWRGRVMCGEVHDENCYALEGSGHAGLFGSAEAVLRFAHNLLLRDASKDTQTRLLRTALSPTRSHGWEIAHSDWHGGHGCSENTIGHTGFTGTGLWIDFDAGIAWTLLTNRVHPSRHTDSGIAALRYSVGNAIFKGD